MALLPSDPKQQKALGAIVLALGLGYAFYTYWYGPRVTELEGMQSHLETLQDRNRQAQIQSVRGGADLEERNALYERHVMELEELIPQSQEVPELVDEVQRRARDMGIRVTSIQPEPDQPGEFYVRQGFALQAVGEYHDVGRFLTAIASMQRIITPVDVEIQPFTSQNSALAGDFEAPVVATFRIETYVLPEPGQGPPPAEVGTGGGA